jgi:hypothetical protein
MQAKDAKGTRGQVLVLVSVGLLFMVGIIGLATDLGLFFLLKKSAQAAADTAALAAVRQALENAGNGTPSCGGAVACQSAAPCPSIAGAPADNLQNGCLYARQNGFAEGGHGGRQHVTVAAGTGFPPSAPGVNDVFYWVTFTVGEEAPRLFSAFYGGRQMVAARATAVITNGLSGGTLYLLNRQNDASPVGNGVNLHAGGNPTVTVPGDIMMASTKDGAGHAQGSPVIRAPFTHIRGAGTADIGGSATWLAAPRNGFADGPNFRDPMAGKGQPPPLPEGGLARHVPVPNGCLSCLAQPLTPGQYFATDSRGRATGNPLSSGGPVTFSDNGSGFANYVFYGGLSFSNGATATFHPGRYVFAGARNGNDVLSYATHVTLQDLSPAGQAHNDAGELFIFTDTSYPGLAGNIPPAVQTLIENTPLRFGSVNLHAGNNADVTVNLHGLNRLSNNVPEDLKDFAPTVLWQDQRNSRVKYDAEGNIDLTSCGGSHTLDNPCTNNLSDPNSPEFHLQAHPNVSFYGLIYQPRGAWLSLQGNGSITSPLVVITGALDLQGGADLAMMNARDRVRMRVAALVE